MFTVGADFSSAGSLFQSLLLRIYRVHWNSHSNPLWSSPWRYSFLKFLCSIPQVTKANLHFGVLFAGEKQAPQMQTETIPTFLRMPCEFVQVRDAAPIRMLLPINANYVVETISIPCLAHAKDDNSQPCYLWKRTRLFCTEQKRVTYTHASKYTQIGRATEVKTHTNACCYFPQPQLELYIDNMLICNISITWCV